jgi:hypothetical protein
MRRRVADFGFSYFGGRFWGHPGIIAAEFAMADDANGSMAAPATEALPNQSMSLVRPAPGVASHPEDHGDRRDRRAAIPHWISSGPIRVWWAPPDEVAGGRRVSSRIKWRLGPIDGRRRLVGPS